MCLIPKKINEGLPAINDPMKKHELYFCLILVGFIVEELQLLSP